MEQRLLCRSTACDEEEEEDEEAEEDEEDEEDEEEDEEIVLGVLVHPYLTSKSCNQVGSTAHGGAGKGGGSSDGCGRTDVLLLLL